MTLIRLYTLLDSVSSIPRNPQVPYQLKKVKENKTHHDNFDWSLEEGLMNNIRKLAKNLTFNSSFRKLVLDEEGRVDERGVIRRCLWN